ncbi:glycosyl hydrolase [Flammeovirgaceae bacterium SG7u.111]|nr:glycosyl hydrolase [Flammeovirgaceae bacterium SG7u.132]WPO35093.1 glycosyl hydrolase [Flammeovirgaceae bacterium SG7u.111]
MPIEEEKNTIDRRSFLKTTGLGTGAMLLGLPTLQGCMSEDARPIDDDFFKGFQHPPALARPFVRWWWNGNHISKEEILRELDLMKNAGIGGVEINPVAMPETAEADPEAGLVWLSNEWCQMVKFVCDEAKKRNMLVDLIVGTGWPFGGEFLEESETIQGVSVEIIDIVGSGPQSIELPKIDEENEKIMQIALIPNHMGAIGAKKDLSDLPVKKGKIEFEAPEATHKLYVVIWKNKFREVMHGAPGGAGPVLDHFNLHAVEKYLDRISDALNPLFEGSMGNGIRSLFCDSIELEGANWTSDLAQEFEKRRGYEIFEYLPLLLDKNFNPETSFQKEFRKVKYDYSLTLAELFKERFVQPFHLWCNSNACQSRYQAYGHPWIYTDLLDGNLTPDIPEGDQWLFNAGWQNFCDVDNIRYAIWNKYAASGGHIKGRKVISTEAMTNTSGVFQASLEYIKQATDLNIATGINHTILHGYNYSPPSAGFPGWVRYGTYFSDQNTWWPYMPAWANYTARLSYVFQESKPVGQIALLGPTPDVWSKDGLDRTAFNFTPWYLHSFWQAFNHNGFMSDFVNCEVVTKASVQKDKLVCGHMAYEAIFICNVINMPPETAEKLVEFAKAGGKVFFVGSFPNKAPGYQSSPDAANRLKKAVELTMNADAKLIQSPPDDDKDNQQELAKWVKVICKQHSLVPKVNLSEPHHKVFVNHQQAGKKEIVFFANMDRENNSVFEAQFPTGKKLPWRWNPETGERTLYPHNVPHILKFDLAPLESILLVFESLGQFDVPRPEEAPMFENGQTINGPWKATFEQPITEETFEKEFTKLADLKDIEELKYFSGTVTYTTSFIPENVSLNILDLGKAHEIVELRINQQLVGTKWWGKKVFDISDMLIEGENELQIKVTTLLYNYCCSLEGNPTVETWRKRSKEVGLLPSGLVGPVVVY